MSNPKFIQDLYLKIWSWPEDIKEKIGDVGDWLQYLLPISFLVYCLFAFGLHGLTIYFVGYFVCCVATSSLIKALFNNLRPREWDDISKTPQISPDMDFDWSPTTANSFVSGHQAASFTAVYPWMLVNPYIGCVALLLACFVGFSRMVVKAHWLRDVVGAIALDTIIAVLFYCFVL